MEVISTIKFQKIKKSAENLREYMNSVLGILSWVNTYIDLFAQPSSQAHRHLAVLVSTEKWLCWSLNSVLFKHFDRHYLSHKDQLDVFVIGKKWIDHCRQRWYHVVESLHLSDNFSHEDLGSLSRFLEKAFLAGDYKEIKVWYNFFKNTMRQIPAWFQLFPLSSNAFESFMESLEISLPQSSNDSSRGYMKLEPSQSVILQQAYAILMNTIVYGAVLHNKTWEFAARMIAMKWAKDNAATIIDDLTLAYNKARQDAITQEVLEIVSAKAVLDD